MYRDRLVLPISHHYARPNPQEKANQFAFNDISSGKNDKILSIWSTIQNSMSSMAIIELIDLIPGKYTWK